MKQEMKLEKHLDFIDGSKDYFEVIKLCVDEDYISKELYVRDCFKTP